jgi:hypothetical protein
VPVAERYEGGGVGLEQGRARFKADVLVDAPTVLKTKEEKSTSTCCADQCFRQAEIAG